MTRLDVFGEGAGGGLVHDSHWRAVTSTRLISDQQIQEVSIE